MFSRIFLRFVTKSVKLILGAHKYLSIVETQTKIVLCKYSGNSLMIKLEGGF